jgi:hypothetical protein
MDLLPGAGSAFCLCDANTVAVLRIQASCAGWAGCREPDTGGDLRVETAVVLTVRQWPAPF